MVEIKTKQRIVVIIQARMKSTRLPEKVLKNIAGKPMLAHVIERLKNVKLIDEIVIATTTEDEDRTILKFADKFGVKSFAGNEEDVLDRYYQAAKRCGADVIVRITSDCPLIDPDVVDKVIAFYLRDRDKVDYVSNSLKRSYPRGLDTEVFSFEVLKRTWQEAKKPHQREHVTPYIREHPEIFHLANVENNEGLSHMRWTVDEERDLQFVREVYKRLYKEGEIFLMEDILTLLRKEPQLMEINKNVKQRAVVEYSLRRVSE